MHEGQIVAIIIFGCALIALGLIPGPLAGLVADVNEALQNFRDPSWRYGITPSHSHRADKLPGQHWLAVAGFVLVTLALLALLAN